MGYFTILIGVFAFSAVLKRVFRLTLFASTQQGAIAFAFFFAIGAVWDSYAVYSGHWFFNDHNLLGVQVGLLPIEEYLFFIVLPFFIITVYQFVRTQVAVSPSPATRLAETSLSPPPDRGSPAPAEPQPGPTS